jgi:preprotein translocase subunit YajC
MIVIRDPVSSLPLALVVPQEPDAPPAYDRGAAPADTGTQQQGEPGPGGPQPQACGTEAILSNLPMLLAFVAIFYFLIIRPGQKQEKARRAMLAALKKGDSVVTNSGIHGTVLALDDATVTVQVDKDVKLKLDRAAVGRVATREETGASSGNGGGS